MIFSRNKSCYSLSFIKQSRIVVYRPVYYFGEWRFGKKIFWKVTTQIIFHAYIPSI